MTRAHLLIQANPGAGQAVQEHLAGIPGVVEAAGTTGPFDAVAQVTVEDEGELQRVLQATRSAPGLARICLCRGN
jgi:DNA-binding Lrp family transcriptional regulator